MQLPKRVKVFIIEGIAGAGKDTLHSDMLKQLKGKNIYDFREEELLFSWKHAWINNIQDIRLRYMDKVVDYIEEVLKQDDKAVFILNRFHISLIILAEKFDAKLPKGYNKFIKRKG